MVPLGNRLICGNGNESEVKRIGNVNCCLSKPRLKKKKNKKMKKKKKKKKEKKNKKEKKKRKKKKKKD